MNWRDIVKIIVPDVDMEEYDYRGGENFRYNHIINEQILDSDFVVNKHEDLDSWTYTFVISVNDKFFQVGYREGSHGYSYAIDWCSLKEVFPKQKTVTYYE